MAFASGVSLRKQLSYVFNKRRRDFSDEEAHNLYLELKAKYEFWLSLPPTAPFIEVRVAKNTAKTSDGAPLLPTWKPIRTKQDSVRLLRQALGLHQLRDPRGGDGGAASSSSSSIGRFEFESGRNASRPAPATGGAGAAPPVPAPASVAEANLASRLFPSVEHIAEQQQQASSSASASGPSSAPLSSQPDQQLSPLIITHVTKNSLFDFENVRPGFFLHSVQFGDGKPNPAKLLAAKNLTAEDVRKQGFGLDRDGGVGVVIFRFRVNQGLLREELDRMGKGWGVVEQEEVLNRISTSDPTTQQNEELQRPPKTANLNTANLNPLRRAAIAEQRQVLQIRQAIASEERLQSLISGEWGERRKVDLHHHLSNGHPFRTQYSDLLLRYREWSDADLAGDEPELLLEDASRCSLQDAASKNLPPLTGAMRAGGFEADGWRRRAKALLFERC
mmetsp:Transcript_9698/g.23874  ORF Transcript_9698/g.23874 Transcript_9698/m.23874 type:complete len:447 (-) Transcript_9698:151-1491(-)